MRLKIKNQNQSDEKLKAEKELLKKLEIARAQSVSGEKGVTHKQMISKLHSVINVKRQEIKW